MAVKKQRTEIIINNFIGGISWGIGTTIGLAIFVTILSFILKQMGLVPIVGKFVIQLSEYVAKNQ